MKPRRSVSPTVCSSSTSTHGANEPKGELHGVQQHKPTNDDRRLPASPLKEAGVRHLFYVPGDYNLELLQQLQDTDALKWVGTCSELNASYAADGYACLTGLGALLVTNSVGALSRSTVLAAPTASTLQ